MHGGGDQWVFDPWGFLTSYIIYRLASLGAESFAGDGTEADGGFWG